MRAAEAAAPSLAAPSIADAELLAREQRLQAREAALAAREREHAEQRRVFTENRLMRRSLTTHARPPEPPQVTLVRSAGTVENVLTRVWRALARSPEQPVTDRVSS